MTHKHLFANAIGELFQKAFDYPLLDIEEHIPIIEAKCELAAFQVGKSGTLEVTQLLPKYLVPVIAFLVHLYKNHFNDKGKFRIKLTQWPSLIKAIGVLVFSLINISKNIV